MFSDVLNDAMYEIIESLNPDYAYIEIYDRTSVIKVLTHMRYLIFLSDNEGRNKKDKTQFKMELYDRARKYATNLYDTRMKIPPSESLKSH